MIKFIKENQEYLFPVEQCLFHLDKGNKVIEVTYMQRTYSFSTSVENLKSFQKIKIKYQI